jgi:hypothetical protein
MDTITFGCGVTNKKTVGDYNYFVFSRLDNYLVILREKTDGSEYLFKVLSPDDDLDTIWADVSSEEYLRPDQMEISLKKYILTKYQSFIQSLRSDVENW